MTTPFPTSPFASVLDQVRAGERHPIEALAYSEPDENNIKQIAPHVFAAANEARRRIKGPGKVSVSLTFNPDRGTLELIPPDRKTLDRLLDLGPEVTVNITW
jgi:hypothetical protein